MESFGEYLKGLREEKSKTLEQIAENTKIALANLESLERDRYDLLPPRVFVKGFIRSYAQEVGANPDETVAHFEEFSKKGELPDYAEEEHPVFHKKPQAASFISSGWFTAVLTLAGAVSLVILLLTGAGRLFYWNDAGGGKKFSGKEISGALSKTSNEKTEEDVPEITMNRPSSGRKILEVKAIANTWVRIEPDSGPAEELMMSPGDVQTFEAGESFHIQTGNAGGIRLRFEGKELPPLGKINQTLSLSLP